MDCNGGNKKKRFTFYNIQCVVECLLVIALSVAVILKCTCGFDLTCFPCGLNNAVEIVASTIGLGSILLVWLFAELDKTESGFKYSQLLCAEYSSYPYFVLVHLCAVLLALFFAKLRWIASACISLALVLWSCVLHWKALSILVFKDEKRKEIAVNEWNRKINRSKSSPGDGTDQLSIIFSISDALSMQEVQHNPPLYDCFTSALLVLATRDEPLEQRIYRLVSVWDRLLRTRQPNECPAILGDVFRRAGDMLKGDCSQALGVVCASYVLWLFRHYSETADDNAGLDDVMGSVADDVEFITQRDSTSEYSRIANYLKASFAVQAWMHFLCGNIYFSYDIFLTCPSLPLTEDDKTLLRAFVQCIFSGPQVDRHFKIAMTQIDAIISKQKEPVGSGC